MSGGMSHVLDKPSASPEPGSADADDVHAQQVWHACMLVGSVQNIKVYRLAGLRLGRIVRMQSSRHHSGQEAFEPKCLAKPRSSPSVRKLGQSNVPMGSQKQQQNDS